MSDAPAADRADSTTKFDGDGLSLTCRVFKHGQAHDAPVDLDHISEILKEEGSLVWLDVVDPGPSDLELIQEEFDLHPLAVEDAIHAHQRPKIESFGSYWFIVVQAMTTEDNSIKFHEIAVFAGSKFLVTVRHDPVYPLTEIEQRWCSHPEGIRRGGGFLLYTILDTVVDGYMPVAATFEDRVDDLEEDLFQHREKHDVLPEIFQMKKEVQRFRWAVLPMRDILNPIIREDLKLFTEDALVYFRDVYDHAVRVIDQLDSVRDMVNSALEIHVSVVGNRQNEVARQLTVIATIFLPLTFITGFFGQNFGFLINTILPAPWAFWVLGIGIELLVVGITIGYFKKQGWF